MTERTLCLTLPAWLCKVLFLGIALSCSKKNDDGAEGEKEQKQEIFLEPISELEQAPGMRLPGGEEDVEPTLIGGRAADPKDFPASFYAAMGGSRCTATVVGPQVLFIAAHCVGNGSKATITHKGEKIAGVCEHSSDYRRNSTADYALCAFGKVIEGIEYEVVNQDESRIKVGDEILLTGFGCVRPGGGGGNDGVYRIGEAKVSRVPRGSDNDIVTGGGAALCFGDSGGPAFKIASGMRYQVSINSRGDIRQTSYLSALHTDQAKKFITSWSEKTGLKICGVHKDVPNCRGLKPEPTPPPSPPPSPSPTPPGPPSPLECQKIYETLKMCLRANTLY